MEKCKKGMYVVDEIEDPPNAHSRAMVVMSLSQAIPLSQWHCQLTHCSPSTINEMVKGDLVDSLKISRDDLQGKCEDCMLRHQTCWPFDGETEKGLDPLKLVSFDLWGPSRVQSTGGKVYLMTCVDSRTSYKYGVYLADKSDASTIPAFDQF
jgi:hypothetical protein